LNYIPGPYAFCEAFRSNFDGISGIKHRQRACYRLKEEGLELSRWVKPSKTRNIGKKMPVSGKTGEKKQ